MSDREELARQVMEVAAENLAIILKSEGLTECAANSIIRRFIECNKQTLDNINIDERFQS